MRQLPAVRTSIDLYMSEISRFSVLSREEEYELAVRWTEYQDKEAAHRLLTSNLRFVIKIAREYLSYGPLLSDLIQEGNIGLMMALKKFNPYRGYRFISYAVWWIRAYIQNFIMKTWSMVKIGTTQAQRKLFYSFQKLNSTQDETDREEKLQELAEKLHLPDKDILEMELRMSAKDFSLDAELGKDTEATHQALLPDLRENQEEALARLNEQEHLTDQVQQALTHLNEKEKYIIKHRVMAEQPVTLRQIGQEFNISRERVRQIEANALKKLKGTIALSQENL